MKEIKIKKELNYIHLISGGLDSTYSLMDLTKSILKGNKTKSTITPVFFDYGQYAAKVEYECALKVVNKIIEEFNTGSIIEKPINISLHSELFCWCKNVAFTGIEIGDISCEIQNRNMVLVSTLASYLFACAENQKIDGTSFEIYSGFKDGEMRDCNSNFFNKLSEFLLIYKPNYKITLNLLRNLKRQQVINRMKKLLKGDETKYKQFKATTISCYAPKDGKACGSCWKCRHLKSNKL